MKVNVEIYFVASVEMEVENEECLDEVKENIRKSAIDFRESSEPERMVVMNEETDEILHEFDY